MSSSNTGNTKNSTEEHVNCGTDDCCQMCDTAVVGDTPPKEAIAQLAKDVMTKHVFNTKYSERDWNRTVGYGKVPEKYRKEQSCHYERRKQKITFL